MTQKLLSLPTVAWDTLHDAVSFLSQPTVATVVLLLGAVIVAATVAGKGA